MLVCQSNFDLISESLSESIPCDWLLLHTALSLLLFFLPYCDLAMGVLTKSQKKNGPTSSLVLQFPKLSAKSTCFCYKFSDFVTHVRGTQKNITYWVCAGASYHRMKVIFCCRKGGLSQGGPG